MPQLKHPCGFSPVAVRSCAPRNVALVAEPHEEKCDTEITRAGPGLSATTGWRHGRGAHRASVRRLARAARVRPPVPGNGAPVAEPLRVHRASVRLLASVGPLVRRKLALAGEPLRAHRASARLLARVSLLVRRDLAPVVEPLEEKSGHRGHPGRACGVSGTTGWRGLLDWELPCSACVN